MAKLVALAPAVLGGAAGAAGAMGVGATLGSTLLTSALGTLVSTGIGKMMSGSSKTPKPVTPAAPAPTRRTDTGASVSIGTTQVQDQRVSGGGTRASGSSGASDLLGGLGRGSGINL